MYGAHSRPVWLAGHEVQAEDRTHSDWWWTWAGDSVAGVEHTPFGTSARDGTVAWSGTSSHLSWATSPAPNPGNAPRCTYVNRSWAMLVDSCASSSMVRGFIVEFTNPVVHQHQNTFYEIQPQLLYWHNAGEIAGANLYHGLPGHLLTWSRSTTPRKPFSSPASSPISAAPPCGPPVQCPRSFGPPFIYSLPPTPVIQCLSSVVCNTLLDSSC